MSNPQEELYFGSKTPQKPRIRTKSRKAESTPKSQVRNALRQVFLRSRERAAALKAGNYTCARCGRKQSMAKGKEFKVQVHHKHGVANWDEVLTAVYKYLLVHPDNMEVLCKECHDVEHKKEA